MQNTVNIQIEPLQESQLRQYIDASSIWRSWESLQREMPSVRGSMRWRELRGKSTLLRISPSGAQTVIGKDDAESRLMFEKFMSRKKALEDRVRSLGEVIAQQRRMNKALQVGRVPTVVIKILNAIRAAGLDAHVMTIGIHAIFAYESASGVRVRPGALATQDVDLFIDARKHLSFFAQMDRKDASFIKILQKADPTFEVRSDQKQTAVNAKGFEVDVVRRIARDSDPHPMRVRDDEEDLWAVQIPTADLIESAQHFDQMIVSVSGEMATMRTIDPASFVRLKRKIAGDPKRDPLKRPKDALQANIVGQLIAHYMPQWLPEQSPQA